MAEQFAERANSLFSYLEDHSFDDPRTGRACLAALISQEYGRQTPQNHRQHTKFLDGILESLHLLPIPADFDTCDIANTLPGKRYPSLFEAITATTECYAGLLAIRNAFSPSTKGGLYGGSLAYGPFFSVRKGIDASDIDIVFHLGSDDTDTISDAMAESPYFEESDFYTFTARLPIFLDLADKGKAEVLSQRFKLANSGLTASVHFMTDAAISNVFGKELQRVLAEDTPEIKTKIIKDYKPSAFEKGACVNYDFSGRPHVVPVANEPVNGGFISGIPAYNIEDSRYAPGLYQSLALPTSHTIGDFQEFSRLEQDFHSTIEKRLALEQERYDTKASIGLANPRSPILPPDVKGILDELKF